jgi:hypothetical protein
MSALAPLNNGALARIDMLATTLGYALHKKTPTSVLALWLQCFAQELE